MDIVLAALRLIHIVAAVLWIGLGFTLIVFVGSVVGDEPSFRYLKALYTRTRLVSVFPAVALVTTLAGILLYLTGSPARFSTAGNIVLGIGAVAGLLTFGHGAGALGPLTAKLAGALAQSVPDDQPIPSETLTTLRGLIEKYNSNGRISLILGLIALVGMGAARYL